MVVSPDREQDLMQWRLLWPVKGTPEGPTSHFVSLDFEFRIAHFVSPNAPAAQVAAVYYDNLTRWFMLPNEEWQAEYTKWTNRKGTLLAKFGDTTLDGQKGIAYYEALDECRARRDEGKKGPLLPFLYDEQEQP